MAESILLEGSTKKEKYASLFPQLEALTSGEPDALANLSNVLAALKYSFDFFWIGIYIVKNDQLVLGPFQGPVACTRINKGKGVCGTAWSEKRTLVVDDVDQFPGHIACSSLSKSEIVVPGYNPGKEVAFVLDVDSTRLADFDETDRIELERITRLLENFVHELSN